MKQIIFLLLSALLQAGIGSCLAQTLTLEVPALNTPKATYMWPYTTKPTTF